MAATFATGGSATPATHPPAHRCGRCGAWATRHFGPPIGHPDKGRLHACADHAPAAEAKWRQIYEVTE